MKIEYEGRDTHLKVTQTSCKPSKFVMAPEYFHEYINKKKTKTKNANIYSIYLIIGKVTSKLTYFQCYP